MNLIALYEIEKVKFKLSYLITDNKSMVESLKSIKKHSDSPDRLKGTAFYLKLDT